MRLSNSDYTNLQHTVFQLSHSIGRIIAFHKGVPPINALVFAW